MNGDLAATYDRIAKDWHRDHQADDWWQKGTDYFISQLPRGASVLDVGCGSGVKAKYLDSHGLAVTGVDISQKLLDIAQEETPGAQFRKLSMLDLDQLSEEFDGVFAQASLLHIPKASSADAVRKMAERTVVGGLVYIAVKELREGHADEEVLKEDDYGYPYERFFSYYKMAELETYLKAAGLEIIWQDHTQRGKTVWLQIIGKRC